MDFNRVLVVGESSGWVLVAGAHFRYTTSSSNDKATGVILPPQPALRLHRSPGSQPELAPDTTPGAFTGRGHQG